MQHVLSLISLSDLLAVYDLVQNPSATDVLSKGEGAGCKYEQDKAGKEEIDLSLIK